MKKITNPLALAAALASGLAAAPARAQALDMCQELGTLAETIMGHRQNGATMSDMMQRLEAVDVLPVFKEMGRAVIMDAFSEPQYRSPGYQAQAIRDFRNAVELTCYQNM